MVFARVRDLAATGALKQVPVAAARRVLKFSQRVYYQ